MWSRSTYGRRCDFSVVGPAIWNSLKPGFHYPSWRPELTGDRFPLPVNTGRVDGPSTPLVETGLYCPLTVSATTSKHFCFPIRPCVFTALDIFLPMRYINWCFTYLHDNWWTGSWRHLVHCANMILLKQECLNRRIAPQRCKVVTYAHTYTRTYVRSPALPNPASPAYWRRRDNDQASTIVWPANTNSFIHSFCIWYLANDTICSKADVQPTWSSTRIHHHHHHHIAFV